MATIINKENFIELLIKSDTVSQNRIQRLAGIILEETKNYIYAVMVTFERDLLEEHKTYSKFKRSNNLYTYHPENPNIPVKAHYHVVEPKGKTELYAVSTDGTAHHKLNRGYQIPDKEARELRKLGVSLNHDNILEHLSTFNSSKSYDVLFLLIS